MSVCHKKQPSNTYSLWKTEVVCERENELQIVYLGYLRY